MVETVYEVKILDTMAGVVARELLIRMMSGMLRYNRKKVRVSVEEKGILWYSI